MTSAPVPPTKEEIAALEPFDGLGAEEIHVVTSRAEAEAARDELQGEAVVGFDTESRPTFRKGEKSDGPHLVQFSTRRKAYLFQSHVEEIQEVLVDLLRSEKLVKVGFGLRGDLAHIRSKFGIRPDGILDLDRSFRARGFRNTIGARTAVAMLFGRRLSKPKSVTTSDWSHRRLSPRQLSYAANDAYAALMVYHELNRGPQAAGGGAA